MKATNARCRSWPSRLLLLLGSAASVGSFAAAEPPRCANSGIKVPEWVAIERDRICAASEAAIAFLRDVGFRYQDGLTIRPLRDPPAQYRGSEVGHFDIERNEIRILPLATAGDSARLCSAFDMPMSPTLWSSYISHEVAHAVAERHFTPGVRRFTASEYVAAVVQLVTMEPALRQAVLGRFADLEAYRSADEISSLYYLMAPGHFAVKAYLHYVNLGDAGPEFMRWLLSNGLSK